MSNREPDYAAWKRKLRFVRVDVIPTIRDVFSLVSGFAILGYQLIAQSGVLWPYVIAAGLLGLPSWWRVVGAIGPDPGGDGGESNGAGGAK